MNTSLSLLAALLGVLATVNASPSNPLGEIFSSLSGQIQDDILMMGDHVQEDIQTIAGHVQEDMSRTNFPDTIQSLGQHIAEDVQSIAGHVQADIELVGAHIQQSVQQISQGQVASTSDATAVPTTTKLSQESTPTVTPP